MYGPRNLAARGESEGSSLRFAAATCYPPHSILCYTPDRSDFYSQVIREELSKEFTSEQKEKVWMEAADAVKASYDQLLGRWKEDMDTLLVYVGCESN